MINKTYEPRSPIDVIGNKIWNDGPEYLPDIQFQLMRNNEILGDKVTLAAGVTEHTWTDLDKTDENGVDYVYHIEELPLENYQARTSDVGLTITNTYVSPKTDITVNKVWWMDLKNILIFSFD